MIDDGRVCADDVLDQLIDAARVAGVVVLRARDNDDVTRRTHDDALRRLLDGATDHGLLASVGLPRPGVGPARSGHGRTSPPGVGVIAADRLDVATPGEPGAGWLVDFVALCARVRFPDARCVQHGGVVYAVASAPAERLPELADVAARIIERATDRQRLRVGIGTADEVGGLGAARRMADRVLVALGARSGEPAFATWDEVRELAVLTELAEIAAERPSLLSGPILAMLDPSGDVPPWALQTLRAYLDCSGNVNAAAARVDVHPNTFRYRLTRTASRFDLRLEDPEARLVLGLQLRLVELDGRVR